MSGIDVTCGDMVDVGMGVAVGVAIGAGVSATDCGDVSDFEEHAVKLNTAKVDKRMILDLFIMILPPVTRHI